LRLTVQHDCQREVAQRLTVTQSSKTIAKVLDVSLLRFVYQHVARVRLRGVTTHLGDEPGFRHIEMAAPPVHLFAGFIRSEWRPLRDDIEVGGIFNSASSTSGLVSEIASFIVSTRTK
jgi:hypothetical protein